MLNSSIPSKFQIPWANSAPAANVRNIPTASQLSTQAGAASLTDGFPPLNFVPVSAGGVPPFGQDMNGILRQTTQWLQWVAAGGPVKYDSTFVSAVNGYPAGAQITSNSGHAIYESMVDNNSADPNSGGANWRVLSCVWSGATWQATGSANVQIVNLTPAPTSLSQLTGIPILIMSQGTNTGAVTLNINGLGAIPIQAPGGSQLANGSLLTSYPFEVVLLGTGAFILLSRSNSFFDTGSNGLYIQGPTTLGANIALLGNGSNKFLRAVNTDFRIDNNANSTILTLTDTGFLSTAANISAGGRLRASLGAFGSGDNQSATLLTDFTFSVGGPTNNYIFQKLPTGVIIQMFDGVSANGADFITFPNAFPNRCFQVIACEGNPGGWVNGTSPTVFGTQQITATNFALYVTRLVLPANTWTLTGGIAYRYIAIGN